MHECKNVPLNITINHQKKCYLVFSLTEIWQVCSNLTFNLFADLANKIQSEKKAVVYGGDRQSAAFNFCVLVFRRSQEDRECCSQKSTEVRRGVERRARATQPSQLLGKMKIPANLCLFSHSTNIPSPDCVWLRKQHLTGILKWLLVAVSFWGCFYKCANKFYMSSFVLLSLGL